MAREHQVAAAKSLHHSGTF